MHDMDWILASASPRRRALLKEIIPEFSVLPATGEERVEGNPSPELLVRTLATQKAEEIAEKFGGQAVAVLGADTVVAVDGEVLGKPKDEADAVRMLTLLSGRAHEVYTGVCIVYGDGETPRKRLVDCSRTEVVFRALTKDEIEAYVRTGSPMDKAGAYGIQDGDLVARIEGSFTGVVGLPVELCKSMIERM